MFGSDEIDILRLGEKTNPQTINTTCENESRDSSYNESRDTDHGDTFGLRPDDVGHEFDLSEEMMETLLSRKMKDLVKGRQTRRNHMVDGKSPDFSSSAWGLQLGDIHSPDINLKSLAQQKEQEKEQGWAVKVKQEQVQKEVQAEEKRVQEEEEEEEEGVQNEVKEEEENKEEGEEEEIQEKIQEKEGKDVQVVQEVREKEDKKEAKKEAKKGRRKENLEGLVLEDRAVQEPLDTEQEPPLSHGNKGYMPEMATASPRIGAYSPIDPTTVCGSSALTTMNKRVDPVPEKVSSLAKSEVGSLPEGASVSLVNNGRASDSVMTEADGDNQVLDSTLEGNVYSSRREEVDTGLKEESGTAIGQAVIPIRHDATQEKVYSIAGEVNSVIDVEAPNREEAPELRELRDENTQLKQRLAATEKEKLELEVSMDARGVDNPLPRQIWVDQDPGWASVIHRTNRYPLISYFMENIQVWLHFLKVVALGALRLIHLIMVRSVDTIQYCCWKMLGSHLNFLERLKIEARPMKTLTPWDVMRLARHLAIFLTAWKYASLERERAIWIQANALSREYMLEYATRGRWARVVELLQLLGPLSDVWLVCILRLIQVVEEGWRLGCRLLWRE